MRVIQLDIKRVLGAKKEDNVEGLKKVMHTTRYAAYGYIVL